MYGIFYDTFWPSLCLAIYLWNFLHLFQPSEKTSDDCLQKLKSSLGALTIEKARIENELRTDRKKILVTILDFHIV